MRDYIALLRLKYRFYYMRDEPVSFTHDSVLMTLNAHYLAPTPTTPSSVINTSRPRQNCSHFAYDIFKCMFLIENVWISLMISLKFVPKGTINDIPALVQIMVWRCPSDKPLSEPMMVSLLTQIGIPRLQWANCHWNEYVFIFDLGNSWCYYCVFFEIVQFVSVFTLATGWIKHAILLAFPALTVMKMCHLRVCYTLSTGGIQNLTWFKYSVCIRPYSPLGCLFIPMVCLVWNIIYIYSLWYLCLHFCLFDNLRRCIMHCKANPHITRPSYCDDILYTESSHNIARYFRSFK